MKYLVKSTNSDYYLGVHTGIEEKIKEATEEGYPKIHSTLIVPHKDGDTTVILIMEKGFYGERR